MADADPSTPSTIQELMDRLRSELEVDPALFAELETYRTSGEYRAVYDGAPPLVSVCIVTYNRAKLLTERCLPSVLAQTYENIEVIIVGDGCTDDTAEAVRRLGDPRVRWENRPRANYPQHPLLRWTTAGTVPGNHALTLVRGTLLTHLDDDDEFPADRIEKLVRFLRAERAELVFHPFMGQDQRDQWKIWPASRFACGHVTNGSTLYLSWFKRIPCDPTCYRYPEPADWNRYRKIFYLSPKIARYPEPLLRHFKEHTQPPEGPPASSTR